jgi:hypothetical protein
MPGDKLDKEVSPERGFPVGDVPLLAVRNNAGGVFFAYSWGAAVGGNGWDKLKTKKRLCAVGKRFGVG